MEAMTEGHEPTLSSSLNSLLLTASVPSSLSSLLPSTSLLLSPFSLVYVLVCQNVLLLLVLPVVALGRILHSATVHNETRGVPQAVPTDSHSVSNITPKEASISGAMSWMEYLRVNLCVVNSVCAVSTGGTCQAAGKTCPHQ